MDEMVTVSLLGKHSWRPGKGQPTVHYKMGLHQMPLSQARAMGLLSRIVQSAPDAEAAPDMSAYPFEGRFDEKLTTTLQRAGVTTLAQLAMLSHDDLMSINGVGPEAYERIQQVLGGIE